MKRIKRFIDELAAGQYAERVPLGAWRARRSIYEGPGEYRVLDAEEGTAAVGDWLIDTGMTIRLEQAVELPEHWQGSAAGLLVRAGAPGRATIHEGLVSLDGVPHHGLDRNRSFASLPAGQSAWQVSIELYNPIAQSIDALNHQNEPAEYDPAPLQLLASELVRVNQPLQRLLYTVKVYGEAAELLPEGDLNRSDILHALQRTESGYRALTPEAILAGTGLTELEQELLAAVRHTGAHSRGVMHMVGQSHIDLAWLWPAKETVRKCSRTFSTMSTLLDEYPAFTYAQSQPQTYAYVKEHYPALYDRVKAHIATGRWEVVGGMWIEPDLNIPSGESLVRQLIHGMRFYEEEFGVRPRIEWLPDTFGYCASLPQLLRLADMEYFMTTKMNWNDTNPFPYDLFQWTGIDGSAVLSYLCHGINEYTHPQELGTHWDSFKQKASHPEQMLLYGHGDGGGGVTREMLEMAERSESLPGLPAVKFSSAHAFFDGVRDSGAELPVWQGDMYLELHRGTYTTHARNKLWNRRAEALYREAELWGTLKTLAGGEQGPSLEEGWKLLLFNQFHDIIPGTSIPQVYERSTKDYEQILAYGEEARSAALVALSARIDTRGEGQAVVLFNSLSWDRTDTVTLKGGREWLALQAYDSTGRRLAGDKRLTAEGGVEWTITAEHVPGLGTSVIWLREPVGEAAAAVAATTTVATTAAFDGSWETARYSVRWNERGELTRLYDKIHGREVLSGGEPGNRLQLFHDRPLEWDAWDIDPAFEAHPAGEPELLSAAVVQQGETADILRMSWSLSASTIEQEIVFRHHDGRIDFVTRVDWQESHKLLKVAFPVEVLSDQATYEIPFGAIQRKTHRNTSWETAQYEVCGHRWADLSEQGYGVALLNDCKYGYDVKGSTLRLSLLRATGWPDPGADRGEQFFTYSLLPHSGSWQDADVVKRGCELNQPLQAQPTPAHEGPLPARHAFLDLDSRQVILDTLKPAESGDGYVIRLYESGGGRERISLQLPEPGAAQETNLLERPLGELSSEGGRIVLSMKPYEVKTVRIGR
ncbi:alpha-mannosidase [Paenibacillus sp. 1P07SE]|uniref:alpha-mannosidase n=1 Tax=Paenibacillus sp. 1P07SE TaxID=3132209 RepID=UPI0039A5D4AA